jgi:RNA polymerase primary sigma factor
MLLCTARHELVRANLRLVVAMAHRYRRNGRLPLTDLIQEGNLGLMTAVDRFDPRKGFRFSTYGSWWIRHAIGRALSDKGRAVRLPVHVVELQHKISKARRRFEAKHQRAPERAELAELVGVPERKLERLERTLLQRDDSLGNPDRDGVTGIDVLADEAPGADRLLHDTRLDDALHEALTGLRPMEADILRHRFGLDGSQIMTLREVGEMHGLSRERIRQLQERALQKIRLALTDRGFEGPAGAAA